MLLLIKKIHFHGTFMIGCFFTRGRNNSRNIGVDTFSLRIPSFPSTLSDKINWVSLAICPGSKTPVSLGTLILFGLDAGLPRRGPGLWLRLCPFLLELTIASHTKLKKSELLQSLCVHITLFP